MDGSRRIVLKKKGEDALRQGVSEIQTEVAGMRIEKSECVKGIAFL